MHVVPFLFHEIEQCSSLNCFDSYMLLPVMIQDTEQQIKFDTQQNNVAVLSGNDLKFKSWA